MRRFVAAVGVLALMAARYGPVAIASRTDTGATRFTFEDSLIAATLVPHREGVSFTIRNKSPHAIRLIWDEAAFINTAGQASRVMHAGVRYIERESSQPPSVIPRGATLTDEATPTDNVYYRSGTYGGWSTTPIVPTTKVPFDSTYRRATLDSLRAFYGGKTIQLLLPLQIQGVVNEYTFVFRIKDVRVPTTRYR